MEPCIHSLFLYLQERHHTKVQYQLKSERISLAQVFSKMEQVVEVLGIEDYSVSQTTLDNVSHHSEIHETKTPVCVFSVMLL